MDGIGSANVIPVWDGPGTVKIVCTDSNGDAASQALLDAVYNYIMRPDDPLERLAPSCVILTVAAPTAVSISYSFTVELQEEYTAGQVWEGFMAALNEYYRTVAEDGKIRYSKVFDLIADVEGVKDYTALLINGGTENIPVDVDEYPETRTVTVTEGEVN